MVAKVKTLVRAQAKALAKGRPDATPRPQAQPKDPPKARLKAERVTECPETASSPKARPNALADRFASPPAVSFRMRIRHDDHIALGPGKVRLLEAVREQGSISGAARSLGMSYRRAWMLLDELNRQLRSPATLSAQGGHTGGGCTVTPVGEQIIRLYRDIEASAFERCKSQIDELTQMIRH